MLVNASLRNVIPFSTFLSPGRVDIDPAGMVSPSRGGWSLEFWVQLGDRLHRPAESLARIVQRRDTDTGMVRTRWEEKGFVLEQLVYGARSSVDEAVIETAVTLRDRSKAPLLIAAVRPYTITAIGGVTTVSYQKDSRLVRVNGTASLHLGEATSHLMTGGGTAGHDIDPGGRSDGREITCAAGMAAMGFAWPLKSGENRFHCRMSLETGTPLAGGKINYKALHDEFVSYAGLRLKQGAGLRLPVPRLQQWFAAAKIILCTASLDDFAAAPGGFDFRSAFFTVYGRNRAGFGADAAALVDALLARALPDPKAAGLGDALGSAYALLALVDSFVLRRDADFLKERFDRAKVLAAHCLSFSGRVGKNGIEGDHGGEWYFVREGHPADLGVIAAALGGYAYLARCLGIFGDERTYGREEQRLTKILLALIPDPARNGGNNDTAVLSVYCGAPFRAPSVGDEALRMIMGFMGSIIGTPPIYIRSLGWDVPASLAAADCLLHLKDAQVLDLLDRLLAPGGDRYTLPEIMEPASGAARLGAATSVAAAALLVSVLRNLVFIDNPERMELLPVAPASWFEPGREIAIEDAPSRFGPVSLRVVSTENEIQVHFDKLPTFVPPDIVINLPFKSTVKPEDDFIIKKEFDRSIVINGWPAIVRIVRKS